MTYPKNLYFPKNPAGTQNDLKKFTMNLVDDHQKIDTGRAWRANELRLKSHEDLHKLWYVLLIEKNKLKSDQLLSIQMGQYFYGYNNMLKVRLSMSRLLTVVNERKKLRNEYRRSLEDEYIKKKKEDERSLELLKKSQERRAKSTGPIVHKDVRKIMRNKIRAKKERQARSHEAIMRKVKETQETQGK